MLTRIKSQLDPGNISFRAGYLTQRDYALGALEAYREIAEESIDERLLVACQLPRSLKRFDWFQRMAKTQEGSLKNELDVRAAEQMVREQVGKLLLVPSQDRSRRDL